MMRRVSVVLGSAGVCSFLGWQYSYHEGISDVSSCNVVEGSLLNNPMNHWKKPELVFVDCYYLTNAAHSFSIHTPADMNSLFQLYANSLLQCPAFRTELFLQRLLMGSVEWTTPWSSCDIGTRFGFFEITNRTTTQLEMSWHALGISGKTWIGMQSRVAQDAGNTVVVDFFLGSSLFPARGAILHMLPVHRWYSKLLLAQTHNTLCHVLESASRSGSATGTYFFSSLLIVRVQPFLIAFVKHGRVVGKSIANGGRLGGPRGAASARYDSQ